jgi:3-phosphoshikimate 1-carboxyvinyltransferase
MQKYSLVKTSDFVSQTINVDGDKSSSHRALIFASLMSGVSQISGLLEAEDVMATKSSLQLMGVDIEKKEGKYFVKGNGINSLISPENILNLENSGTGVRLLMGLVSTMPVEAVFSGDKSLNKRPMNRVMDLIGQYSPQYKLREGNFLPLTIKGNDKATAINTEIKVPSAQVKSAGILAALNAKGISKFIEKTKTRDHTEIMMKYLGFSIKTKEKNGVTEIEVEGGSEVEAENIEVCGDPSSAAFLVAACLISRDAKLIIENIIVNPERIGFYQIVKKMGANLKFINKRKICGEEVADIEVHSSKLNGVDVGAQYAPRTIDEYPILAVLASQAQGVTKFSGLEELKVKESNRLSAIEENLLNCGVKVRSNTDSLEIEYSPKIKSKGAIKTYHDHRIAMSFIILGLVAENNFEIDDVNMINTSFPSFFKILSQLGLVK